MIHVTGIALAVETVTALLDYVFATAPMVDLLPVSIYGATLLAALTVSAVYNMWPISPRKWLIRRFDHSAIYILIAGTYTPFLAKLRESLLAQVLLAIIWITSAVGVVLKVTLPGRLDRLSILLYLLLGWSGVVLWDSITTLPTTALWLMLIGGVLYSVGVVFHVWESLPFQNAIWHGFVLAASGCFYGAVFRAYLNLSPVA